MNRHLLLNSWIWSVFEENKDMTEEKLIEEFKKDIPKSMASSLRYELEMLKDKKLVMRKPIEDRELPATFRKG